MSAYNTPDVYVEEISTLPPSIAEVSTAVPAFIGHTETDDNKRLNNVPVRIGSLMDYRSYFGGPYTGKFTAVVETRNAVQSVTVTRVTDEKHLLYYALDHYFKNGGGDCYVVSVGTYDEIKDAEAFQAGLDALRNEDEPTLIVLSEAATLNEVQYYGLCQQALLQCADLKDRFCILDVLPKDKDDSKTEPLTGVAGFRYRIGMEHLKYGAAYYPYLNTSINYAYADGSVSISGTFPGAHQLYSVDLTGITASYVGTDGDNPQVQVTAGTGTDISFEITGNILTIVNVDSTGTSGANIINAWGKWSGPKKSFSLVKTGDGQAKVAAMSAPAALKVPAAAGQAGQTADTLGTIKNTNTGLYNLIKQELNKFMVVLPPAPAMAGVYASTDRERGVWKAPANVSLNAVISPVVKISAEDQDMLNVDPTSGKSVNAIRSFFGKGTLVWGARTLAGNDNEWRYISVRRLFNMIEESAKKASYFAVFESNDAVTWLKVRGMIESYLYGLWQQGALAGSTSKAAYYVNVGLGTTMTQTDVLEGRMIIEIGLAAVRPAEFIILRFSHKLQEA